MVKRASSRLITLAARIMPSWVGWLVISIAVYVLGMYLASSLLFILSHTGMFASVDAATVALVTRIVTYSVLVALMVGVPAWLYQRISLRDMGMNRLMTWKDIGVGIAGVVVYILLAMGALALIRLIPGVDLTQTQELDVGQVFGTARMMMFVTLVIITPFAEELLFRGILYGGLRARRLPAWVSALIVSALFGLAHGQLNVGIDVFCLSLVACYAREITGSIWAGVVLHMIKNFIAFAVVFLVNQGIS